MKPKRTSDFHWQITFGFPAVFALVGLVIGWSIDTKHPADRIEDVLIPTLIFLAAGLLLGYVTSLVRSKRFNWTDAFVSIAIPPICFFGFLAAKGGSSNTGRWLGWAALACTAYLVWRFVKSSENAALGN